MADRRKLIAGNWKLHNDLAASRSLASAVAQGAANTKAELVVAPVFTALTTVAEIVRGAVGLAAQDVHWEDKGAFTGEVSAPLLRDVGCSYVIVGHSERRQFFGDTDERVAKKVAAVFRAGLLPIACVGETLEERERGDTLNVVLRQTEAILGAVEDAALAKLVIAYEPVWAIGTGKVAKPSDAQEVHAAIRAKIRARGAAAEEVRILYGGSVKPDNAKELLSQPDIDGALVGGASLDAAGFLAIAAAS